MHPTIRRRPLFVGFMLITLGGLLNTCQPSEARPSSALVIATAIPKAAPTVTIVLSPATTRSGRRAFPARLLHRRLP
jgi:hypothetical protein